MLSFALPGAWWRTRVGLPEGYGAYPGGALLAYDPATKEFENIARLAEGEGVLSFTRCPDSGRMYCLTWPTGHFVVVEPSGTLRKLDYQGRGQGEKAHPRTGDYRCVCRSILVGPDQCVYFTNAQGDLLRFDPSGGEAAGVEVYIAGGLKLDYFGTYDWTQPGSMCYNWRQVCWHPTYRGGCVLGVHGNSGYLFAIFLDTKRVEVITRLTSLPSQRSGMFDLFSYGYLGFTIEGDTVYYLTGVCPPARATSLGPALTC